MTLRSRRFLSVGFVFAALVLSGTVPARAWECAPGWHGGWGHPHGWYGGWRGGWHAGWRPGFRYGPPRVYYAPPVAYLPPPRFYGELAYAPY